MKHWKYTWKNTGKVREICQSESEGTMGLLAWNFQIQKNKNGSWTTAILVPVDDM